MLRQKVIGASLSKPHHRRSAVKSVFLLVWLVGWFVACLLAYIIPYMGDSSLHMDDNGLHKYKLKHINGPLIPFKCQP